MIFLEMILIMICLPKRSFSVPKRKRKCVCVLACVTKRIVTNDRFILNDNDILFTMTTFNFLLVDLRDEDGVNII